MLLIKDQRRAGDVPFGIGFAENGGFCTGEATDLLDIGLLLSVGWSMGVEYVDDGLMCGIHTVKRYVGPCPIARCNARQAIGSSACSYG